MRLFACFLHPRGGEKENGESWKDLSPAQGQDLQPHSPFMGGLKSISGLFFGSESQHLPAAASQNAREGQESSTLHPCAPGAGCRCLARS